MPLWIARNEISCRGSSDLSLMGMEVLTGALRQHTTAALLSLSEIKSERTDGVIRRAWVSEECARMPEQPGYRCILVQGKVCSRVIVILHIQKEHVAQVPLPEDDDMVKAILAGANQSAVPHVHSAMASVAQLAGHECPWREAAG